ncbi:MAG TPA: class I SAM-dependent methyltransferase [Longilinea sp.]|nr:class I SAM-dependent methyltransferase [Longilinea sp.]
MSRLISTFKNRFLNRISRILGVLFHLLYTTFAWAYDLVAGFVSLGRWQKWVISILPLTMPSPALELGFGTGHLLEAVSLITPEVYGIDLSRQMCSLTQKRIRKTRRDLKISCASTEGIPFANESMSTIFSTFPAPYIFSEATATEIDRILKPGGVLVVLLSVEINGSEWMVRLMRFLFRWAGSQQIDQRMIETIFSALISTGLVPRLEILKCGSDNLFVVTMKKEPAF